MGFGSAETPGYRPDLGLVVAGGCVRVVSARATGAGKHGELAGPRRVPVCSGLPDLARPRERAVRRREGAGQPDRCVVAVRVWGSSGSDEGPVCGCELCVGSLG